MVPAAEREALVADFVKRFKYKGPVYQISALTREGCELLVQQIYQHIAKVHASEKAPVDIDPRFDATRADAATAASAASAAPQADALADDPRFRNP
jgi:GTP-binding protein